jgi:hypothetical protein
MVEEWNEVTEVAGSEMELTTFQHPIIPAFLSCHLLQIRF